MNDRLKIVRKKTGLNQNDFADALGISVSNISSYESGRRNPSDAFISLICSKYGINEEWLRYGTGDMEVVKSNDFTSAADQNERVREVRKSYGLTLDKFGGKLGVTKQTVSRIENGVNNVTEQMLKSICREFNVNEEWLRYGTGEMFSGHPDISYKDRIIGAVTFMPDSDAKIIWEFIIKNLNRKNGEEG